VSGESNLIVHNNLEFANDVNPALANNAIINAFDNEFYVKHTSVLSNSIFRTGNAEGHVYGRL